MLSSGPRIPYYQAPKAKPHGRKTHLLRRDPVSEPAVPREPARAHAGGRGAVRPRLGTAGALPRAGDRLLHGRQPAADGDGQPGLAIPRRRRFLAPDRRRLEGSGAARAEEPPAAPARYPRRRARPGPARLHREPRRVLVGAAAPA